MKGYDVEAEDLEPLAAQPVDATVVAEATVPTEPEPSAAADADVDVAISEEYGAETADKDVLSLDVNETSPVLEDASDSLATIIATPASAPSSDVNVSTLPAPESFLASMSRDQFTFPPKPAYSDSGASAGGARDDVVLVDSSEEGESVKSGEDGWSEIDA